MPLSLSFENFEGSLELLVALVQKNELSIESIPLDLLVDQLARSIEEKTHLDQHAEHLPLAARLLLLKSRALLPKSDHTEIEEDLDRIHLFEKLVEYCRFKEVARLLEEQESKQSAFFHRPPTQPVEPPLKPELDKTALSAQELSNLLQEMLKKAPLKKTLLLTKELFTLEEQQEWLLSKITQPTPFYEIFSENFPILRVITLFLALLELMKQAKLSVVKRDDILIEPISSGSL